VHAHHVPIEICDGCGESFSGPEAARVEHEAICRALDLPTPSEIIALRERLQLSQAEFSELTGIGKATISRWERGRMLPNRALARYLQLLARDPANVTVLKSIVSASRKPAVPAEQPQSQRDPKQYKFEPVPGLTRRSVPVPTKGAG